MKVPLNYFFEKLNRSSVESSSAFAEDQEQFVFTDNDVASERELVTLVRAFNDINDIKVRKGLLDFVRSLASERSS